MSAVRWVEFLVVAVFTYQVTGSAFIVAMMTLLRLLPMALFGAFMGAWADRLDRRLAMLGVLVATLLSSAAVAALASPAGSKSGTWPYPASSTAQPGRPTTRCGGF